MQPVRQTSCRHLKKKPGLAGIDISKEIKTNLPEKKRLQNMTRHQIFCLMVETTYCTNSIFITVIFTVSRLPWVCICITRNFFQNPAYTNLLVEEKVRSMQHSFHYILIQYQNVWIYNKDIS